MDESFADVNLEPHEPTASPVDGAPAVFISEGVMSDMNCHAAEEPEHEIGGIMIGTVIGGDHPVVLVEASIRGAHMTHNRGSVTFTHDTWSEINRVKDDQYPDKLIVGWYHSHPGFGIFLSNYDLFIHKSFFTAPWQVAYVTDPKAKTYGCFTWQGGDLAAEPSFQVAATPRGYQAGAPAHPDAPLVVQLPAQAAPAPRDRGLMLALCFLGVVVAMLAALSLANYALLVKMERRVATAPAVVAPATPAEPTPKPPASELVPTVPESTAPAAGPPSQPAAPAAPTESRSPDARPGPASS